MKVKFGTIPLVYPIPIVLAGTNVQGKPNYATLGDCGIMGIKPALIYISLSEKHYTTQGVLAHSTFSVNFPPTSLLAEADYCGMVSGRDVDKAALFTSFYGELETAPMIEECPVNLECRVIKDFTVQHRHIFVGEVIQVYVDETCVVEDAGRQHIVDMTKLDPIIYALDNRYYKIGEIIGTGYHEGKTLQKS